MMAVLVGEDELAGRSVVLYVVVAGVSDANGFGEATGADDFAIARFLGGDAVAASAPPAYASSALSGGVSLSASAPSPFREAARLTLTLPQAQPVRVALYDALGREVAVLHDGPLDAA